MSDLLSYSHSEAKHRLVMLHGWGADADDLVPFGQKLICGLPFPVELISLRAPEEHPSGHGRQWYGLFPSDWQAVPNAVISLKSRLLDLAKSSIPLEKTVLLGFSQGGAMGLSTGSELPLAGLICCSGYPHPEWIPNERIPPVFLSHGKLDEVVPAVALKKIIDSLKEVNVIPEVFSFKGGHNIPLESIPEMQRKLSEWLF